MSPDPLALSFGSAAEAYERGRPGWPTKLLDTVPLADGAEVLDLGAGTGKLTRLLTARYRVDAVEPDPAMRAVLEHTAPCRSVTEGIAEAIPLADDSVDGVFVAEAFHWFDPKPALAEIERVLRRRGVLALLWNRWQAGLEALPDGVLPRSTTPKHTLVLTGAWRRPFEHGPFEPLREASLEQERAVPRAELVAYFASISPVASLPPDERHRVLDRVSAALDRPTYRRRWTTHLYWTRLAA